MYTNGIIAISFVIKRNDGKYVAAHGSDQSYTDKLEEAQRYGSYAAAHKDCCMVNEAVYSLEQIFKSLVLN